MSISDHSLEHKLGVETIYYTDMQGLLTSTTLASLGAGNRTVVETGVAASELAALTFTAAADEVYFMVDAVEFGAKADLTRDIQAQIVWFSSAVGGNIQWSFAAKGLTAGEVLTDAKVTPDASITFVAQAGSGTVGYMETERKALNSGGLFVNDKQILMAVTLAAQATITAQLLAVRLYYTTQITDASGRRQLT